MSCRGVASRFGVAPSPAIELVGEWRSTDACEGRVQGGDRRSARIEGHVRRSSPWSKPHLTLRWPRLLTILAHGKAIVARAASVQKRKRITQQISLGLHGQRGRAQGLFRISTSGLT
jgi:hypothetical protein